MKNDLIFHFILLLNLFPLFNLIKWSGLCPREAFIYIYIYIIYLILAERKNKSNKLNGSIQFSRSV